MTYLCIGASCFRRIDNAAVDFTIAWMDGIKRGHRVSDRNRRSRRTWIVLAIFRTNLTAARPNLIFDLPAGVE